MSNDQAIYASGRVKKYVAKIEKYQSDDMN